MPNESCHLNQGKSLGASNLSKNWIVGKRVYQQLQTGGKIRSVQREWGLQGFQRKARAALALYLAGSVGSSLPWSPEAGCPVGRAGRSAGSRSPPRPGTGTPGTALLPRSARSAGETRLQNASAPSALARHGDLRAKRHRRETAGILNAHKALLPVPLPERTKHQLEKNSRLNVLPHLGQRKGPEQRKAQHLKK